MKKKYFKIVSSILVFAVFLLIAYGSGSTDKDDVFIKNNKECFCGIEFTDTKDISAIGMEVKIVTILNCDGTFTSGQDWSADKEHEDTYNATVGRSSGNKYNFSGNWELAKNISLNDLPSYFTQSDIDNPANTFIRFKSSNGKTRYARVYVYEKSMWVEPIAQDSDCYEEKTYHEEDLGLFGGKTYFYGDIPK